MSRLLPLGLLFLVQLVVFHHSSRIPMDSPSAQATPPDVGTIESLDSDCEMSSIDAGSYTSSNRDSDFIPWEEVQEIQLLHEATLQELLSLVPEVWFDLPRRHVSVGIAGVLPRCSLGAAPVDLIRVHPFIPFHVRCTQIVFQACGCGGSSGRADGFSRS